MYGEYGVVKEKFTVDVLILGAGVSGLSTGLRLLDQGHAVAIWARDLPPRTTSNVAAAVWYPYRAHPVDRVTAWGAEAYQEFLRLLDVPESGVIRETVYDLRPMMPDDDPPWAGDVANFHRAGPAELPRGYAGAFVFDAPVIDTSVYMAYLLDQFRQRGGQVEHRAIQDMDTAFAACPVAVNCTGLGARELVGDTSLRPSRGQVLRVRPNGFRRVLLDDDGPNALAYIVPRISDIILGGTDLEGVENTDVDPATTAAIRARCARLAPAFAGLTPDDILDVKVGLRPLRPSVRLERERVAPERWLVHNYGHGGAGITLSWGCASEAARLVTEIAGDANVRDAR